MSYLCIDCGQRFNGRINSHRCPNPGSMAKLSLEIKDCSACGSSELQGDFCGEHYRAVCTHPGSVYYEGAEGREGGDGG